MHNFAGIDPGKTGAIVVIGETGNYIAHTMCPKYRVERCVPKSKRYPNGRKKISLEDINKMVDWVDSHLDQDDIVVLERVGAWSTKGRRQGATSMFSFGTNYGIWRGIIHALRIPIHYATPAKWQNSLFGTKRVRSKAYPDMEIKDISHAYAIKTFPKLKITKVAADAFCIAEFCRQVITSGAKDRFSQP